jgi:hypothetical protein
MLPINTINADLLLFLMSIVLLCTLIYHYKICNENYLNNKEGFRLFYESSPSTRNMSYDLRCEPVIPKCDVGIMNSSIEPHYRRKCLDIM